MLGLLMLLGACATTSVSESALADGLRLPLAELADAVRDDGGPKSKAAARNVIAKYLAAVGG
jgi:hypothetical protein